MSRSVSVGRIRRAFGSHPRLALAAAAAVAPLGLIVVGTAQPAGATPLACGTYVTSNLTLTANLNCSSHSGDALDIGANGVTVNLNGFTITGPEPTHGGDGIYSEENNNVTIENGTIKNFYDDVFVSGGNNLKVQSVKLLLNGSQDYTGFRGQYLWNATVTNITSSNAYRGTDVAFSDYVTIASSSVNNSETGFHEFESTGDTYTADAANSSGDDGFSAWYSSYETYSNNMANGASDAGFEIKNYDNGPATIQNNVATNDGEDGFYLYENTTWDGTSGETVTGNKASGSYDGIDDRYSTSSTFSHNTASNNGGNGIYLDEPGGDTITHNTTRSNEYGIQLYYNYGSDNASVGSFNTSTGNSNTDLYAPYKVPGVGNNAVTCTNWVCI